MNSIAPRKQWLAVKRDTVPHCGVLIVPTGDMLEARAGQVVGTGGWIPVNGGWRAHDCNVGERILYSARVDQYRINGSDVDLIEEASVIGKLP